MLWNQDMPEIDVRTLGARLRKFREEKGISQRELARRAGIGQKTLNRIENGEMLLMSPHLPKLASKLQLLLNDPFAGNFLEPSQIRGMPVPVWDRVQAGKWAGVAPHMREPENNGWIVPQEPHGPDTFAMIVNGDSMLPLFNPGDIVVVDPDRSPRSGRFVVAKSGESGEASLKQFASRRKDEQGRDKFELRPLNDVYETLYSDREQISILGVVVEKTTRFV